MIRNQWYVVLESSQVGEKPVGVTRMGEKMVFWRDQAGKVCAAVDRCPHRGVALSAGKKQAGHLQCPFHGFEFDSSGKCVLIPANGRNGVIPNAMQLNTGELLRFHRRQVLVLGFVLEFFDLLALVNDGLDDVIA